MTTTTRAAVTALARPAGLSLDAFARRERSASRARGPVREPRAARRDDRRARASCASRPANSAAPTASQRLRRDLSLNYAALGLVLDLLERIDHLEAVLATAPVLREERRAHGHEQADTEVTGGPARRPDQGVAIRPHRGRRRAPVVGAPRPARGARTPAARTGRCRSEHRAARPRSGAGSPTARHRPGRGARTGLRDPAALPIARRGRGGGEAPQGRVRLGRAPGPRAARRRFLDRGRACPGRGRSEPRQVPRAPSPICAATSG